MAKTRLQRLADTVKNAAKKSNVDMLKQIKEKQNCCRHAYGFNHLIKGLNGHFYGCPECYLDKAVNSLG